LATAVLAASRESADAVLARCAALAFGVDEGATGALSACLDGELMLEPFPSELLAAFCARSAPNPMKAAHASTTRRLRIFEFMAALVRLDASPNRLRVQLLSPK
jgi:hypothetical protein